MSFQGLPILIVPVLFFGVSLAQATNEGVSVDHVVQEVLRHNPELLQAQARVQEQAAAVHRVKGGWHPRVTGAYTTGRMVGGISTNTFEVGVSQAIYNPVLKRAVRQAEAAKLATMKSVESLQLHYVYRSHIAFYRVVKAQEALQIRTRQLQSLKVILKDAETRSRIGIEDEEAFATTLGDMNDIEARLELDRQEFEVSCQDLKALVGMDEGKESRAFQTQVCERVQRPDLVQFVMAKTDNARVRLSGPQGLTSALSAVEDVEVWGNEWLKSKVPTSDDPVGALLEVAISNRPDRFEALSLIQSGEEEVKGARAAYQPTVSVGGSVGYSNEPGRTGQFNPSGGASPYGRFHTVGATIGGAIYDGSRKGAIQASEARLEQKRKYLDRVENQIRQDVENAVSRVKTSTTVLPKALRSYVAAQKAFLIRSGKARLGTETGMVFQNLLLQQNLKAMDRELNLFQSIVGVLEQEAQLKFATATF